LRPYQQVSNLTYQWSWMLECDIKEAILYWYLHLALTSIMMTFLVMPRFWLMLDEPFREFNNLWKRSWFRNLFLAYLYQINKFLTYLYCERYSFLFITDFEYCLLYLDFCKTLNDHFKLSFIPTIQFIASNRYYRIVP